MRPGLRSVPWRGRAVNKVRKMRVPPHVGCLSIRSRPGRIAHTRVATCVAHLSAEIIICMIEVISLTGSKPQLVPGFVQNRPQRGPIVGCPPAPGRSWVALMPHKASVMS